MFLKNFPQRLRRAQVLVLLVSISFICCFIFTPGKSAQSTTLDSEEKAFVTLINNYRAQNGLGPLQVSVALTNASKWMSGDMAQKNYFSHTDSLGRDPFVRMGAFGYAYQTYMGENIAAGNSTAQATFEQWRNSPGHNQNMLNPTYKVMGIGRVYGGSSTYKWYWTNNFGGYVDQILNLDEDEEVPPPPANSSNLALGKQATQSSTAFNGPANLAVDGNTNGNYSNGSVTATAYESRPWWQVDLGAIQSIHSIKLWNRTDGYTTRLSNFYVFVSDQPFTSTDPAVTQGQAGVSSDFVSSLSGPSAAVAVNRTGRYVRVQLTGTDYLSLAEVQVWSTGGLPAPAANAATNVTSSSFTANWSSSSGATGYRLDVSTNSSFSSYLSGYQNLNVGNVLNWSVSGLNAGTTYYYRVRAYNSSGTSSNSATISVMATAQNFSVTVSASPSAGGTVNGSGTFAAGSSRTVTATANSGYTFTNWTESGNVVSTSTSYTFTLNGNRNLVANFTANPPPGGTVNLALGKPATQSSTSYNGPANLAVDGNTNGNYSVGSVTATAYELRPWWQVDLGSSQTIQTIEIWNRTDGWSERLSNFYVFVSDQPFTSTDPTVTQAQTIVSSFLISSLSGPSTTVALYRTGRYVRIQLLGTNYLSLAEVRVLGGGTSQNYSVTVSASPSAGGTVSGNGTFAAGSSRTVTATANSGYTFTNWTESGNVVSTSTSYTFTLNGNRSLVANFTANPPGGTVNLALGKPATQSSTSYNGPANLAVDGNTNGNYSVGSVTATAYELRPWWQVDLGSSQSIQSIKLWNRTDGWSERLSNFYVFVSNQPFTSTDPTVTQAQAGVSSFLVSSLSGASATVNVNRTGRYVRIQLLGTDYLSLAEVQVF